MNKIIAVLILGSGLFFGFLFGQQVSLEGEHIEVGEVSFMIDFGSDYVEAYTNLPIGNGETMFEILEEVSIQNNLTLDYESYEGLGVLITQIGESRNGSDERYWQYWVNNRSAAVSADSYHLNSGDVVLWKFLEAQLYE